MQYRWLVVLVLLVFIPPILAIDTDTVEQLTVAASWDLGEDHCTAFSSDRLLINDGSQLRIYDLNQPDTLLNIINGVFPCSMEFAGNDQLLIIAGQAVILMNPATGEVLQTFDDHTDEIRSVAMSSSYLVTSQRYGVRLFDVATGELLHEYFNLAEDQGNLVYGGDVAFSPDDSRFIVFGESTYEWESATGAYRTRYPSYQSYALGEYSPDGSRIVIYNSLSASFRLMDATTGDEIQTGSNGNDVVGFSPDSSLLMVKSFGSTTDTHLNIFSAQDGSLITSLHHDFNDAAFSPDSEMIATVRNELYFWDASTAELLATYPLTADAEQVAFVTDGLLVLLPDSVRLYRYESTAAVAPRRCPGSQDSRLELGMTARVAPGSPNNLRAEPSVDGALLDEIPPGDEMLVLAGPVCADGYAWWQVLYNDVGWTAEGTEFEYWLDIADDSRG